MFSLNSRPYIAERIASLDLVGQKQQPTQKCRDFFIFLSFVSFYSEQLTASKGKQNPF